MNNKFKRRLFISQQCRLNNANACEVQVKQDGTISINEMNLCTSTFLSLLDETLEDLLHSAEEILAPCEGGRDFEALHVFLCSYLLESIRIELIMHCVNSGAFSY